MRTGRAWLWRRGRLVGTVLLGLSLLGGALPAGRAMAAPAGRGVARAAVGRPLGEVALPAGLRAALRRVLGPRARAQGPGAPTPIITWTQQAELAASDAASGDLLGYSVALSGNTALVGAEGKGTIAGGVAGVAYVFVRSGTSWSQQAELTAADAASGDNFGYAVALSGNTALVGAPYKNGHTGAAYVFVRSGTTWSQQAELTAADGAADDRFGVSVALFGGTALVGSPFHNGNTGAAYVFVRSGTTWSQQAKLTGAGGDLLGYAVALSGNTALVGAPNKNSQTGAAYVFVRRGTSWSQQAELTASDGAKNDNFGWAVALSENTALVGAYGKNYFTGASYVFVQSGTSWSQQAKLTAADGASGDYFGAVVALSGSTALVGAPDKNGYAGAAYVFGQSGSTWSQQAKLTAADGAALDEFGFAVALSGNSALVGAPFKNRDTGAAYVFVRTTWSQQAEPTASDGASGDQFGAAVALFGSTALVGAPDKNGYAGASYVFVQSGSTWSQQAELAASDGAAGDQFGWSVALSGNSALVGAPSKNGHTGAAYVFVRSGTSWRQQAELTASDAASGDSFGYAVALFGTSALVGAPFKNSQTGAAYVFVRGGTSWNQQVELTTADGAAGDGFGSNAALSGTTALIGAYGKNSQTGAAYVFVQSGGTWSQQAELTASDGAPGDEFSFTALSGNTALVGAPLKNSATGAAYVFVRSGTTWSQQAELLAGDGMANDVFGIVALSGTTALVGAIGKNSGTGAAYVFVRSGTSWSQQAELTASDGGSADLFGIVALSESTALIGAGGTNSGTGAAYVFVRS